MGLWFPKNLPGTSPASPTIYGASRHLPPDPFRFPLAGIGEGAGEGGQTRSIKGETGHGVGAVAAGLKVGTWLSGPRAWASCSSRAVGIVAAWGWVLLQRDRGGSGSALQGQFQTPGSHGPRAAWERSSPCCCRQSSCPICSLPTTCGQAAGPLPPSVLGTGGREVGRGVCQGAPSKPLRAALPASPQSDPASFLLP